MRSERGDFNWYRFWPLGYVLWCCGSRNQDFSTFIQVGSGHTNCVEKVSYVHHIIEKFDRLFGTAIYNFQQTLWLYGKKKGFSEDYQHVPFSFSILILKPIQSFINIVHTLIQFVQKTKNPKHCNDFKFFKLKAIWFFFDKN